MTYCLGIKVKEGLLAIADTRITSGTDTTVKKKITSPAWALLPVRVFTQIPIASHRLESPNSENSCPER